MDDPEAKHGPPAPIFKTVGSFWDGAHVSWDDFLTRGGRAAFGGPIVRLVLTEVWTSPPQVGRKDGLPEAAPALQGHTAEARASVSPRVSCTGGGPSSCAGLHPSSIKGGCSRLFGHAGTEEQGRETWPDGRVFSCEHRLIPKEYQARCAKGCARGSAFGSPCLVLAAPTKARSSRDGTVWP